MMKNKLINVWSILLLISSPMMAQIDITSGVTGTLYGHQSYNETRGVDVTVISPNTILLTAMILREINVGPDNTAIVGARIYKTSTHALLYSHDTTVYNIYYGTVNIPVSFVLETDSNYTIAFFCGGPNSDNYGNMFRPGTLPYVESHGLLKILAARQSIVDTFPGNTNWFDPKMTLMYDTAFITGGNSGIIEPQLNLFPNPFNAQLNISYPNNQPAEITLYDITSRRLFSKSFINTASINTDQLSNGIYLYEIRNADGWIKRGKLVKD